MNAEQERLAENNNDERWHLWGPYLAERAWGTVREDYSANGDAWNYFPHDHARSRAFRWGEDGIGGISDFKQRLCLAFAFWNGRDPILKERLFGVTGPQGSHGEDVKEVYFYTDCTPTHSYMRMLYRYPQARFPYEELVAANHGRPKQAPEFELWDTGILREHRYFDISLEYAKVDPDDFFIRVTATNRGPDAGRSAHPADALVSEYLVLGARRPAAGACAPAPTWPAIARRSRRAITRWVNTSFTAKARAISSLPKTKPTPSGSFRRRTRQPFVKDGINDFIVHGRTGGGESRARRNKSRGALRVHDRARREPGGPALVRPRGRSASRRILRASRARCPAGLPSGPGPRRRSSISTQSSEHGKREADEFYDGLEPSCLSDEHKLIHRQALAGMLWTQTVLSLRHRGLARGRSAASRLRRRSERRAATPSGATSTTSGSCRCPTNGSIPGMRRGTSPSIASRSRWSIRISRRASSISSCANGTSIPTARSPPTNGISATLIRR